MLAAALVTGCATYRPAPLTSDAQLGPYNGRTLDDPALRAWLDSLGVPAPDGLWTPRQLALAGIWFRPERAVRAAAIREADAAVVTAGARPEPGATTDLEYAFSDPRAESRWGAALAGLFTLELGGKRAARIGRARAAALAARATAREEEWRQVNEVYLAALAVAQRHVVVEALQAEGRLQDSVAALSRGRFEAGTLSRLELARVEGEARTRMSEEQRAEREAAAATHALGTALGVPLPTGAAIPVGPTAWPDCPDLDRENRPTLQRTALAARWSVRRAAAEYQVSEGDLRVEVAKASPDLTLGPGVFFDQGTGKFTLGLGLPSLGLTRNRGPIAEAEARRAQAGARLMQTQEAVLVEVDAALAQCSSAAREVLAVEGLVVEAERRQRLVEAAWSRGEVGHLEVLLARLETQQSRRRVLEARLRQWDAGLALERAAGAWGLRSDGEWPGMRTQ